MILQRKSQKPFLMPLLRVVAFFLGMGLFVFSLDRFGGGLEKVLQTLAAVPFSTYAAIFALSLFWTFFYTLAWRDLLLSLKDRMGFLNIFRIKLCGESVNLMTPAGFAVGDPVRLLLVKHFIGETPSASVVADRLMHSVAAQTLCLLSLPLLYFSPPLPWPVWFIPVIALAYGVAIAGFIWFLSWTLKSGDSFRSHSRLLGSFWGRKFPKIFFKIEELRAEVAVYRRHKKILLYAFFWHFLGRLLMAFELAVILFFIHGKWLISFSFILSSLTSFALVMGGIVPGAVGILESLYAVFAGAFGFDPALGIAVQLVRRIRIFMWMAMGLLILDYDVLWDAVRKVRKKSIEIEGSIFH